MNPKRIQLSRRKGFRLPEAAQAVARPTMWGNPFVVGPGMDRQKAVILFRRELRFELLAIETGQPFRSLSVRRMALAIGELKGRDLACWCGPDEVCHADVLLEVANG